MALLDVRELQVRYGAISALRVVNVHVNQGEVVAVLGANGAGKSTLLNAIVGLVKSAAGKVTLAGRDITNSTTESITRAGVGLVPEGRRIFTRLTVRENLTLGGYFIRDRDLQQRIETMFNLFPVLRSRAASHAGHLSGGEQQMLAIARALIARPSLLLLDEPSAGLSPIATAAVYDALRRLAEEGSTTILLVEQSVTRALALASRGYVLELGTIKLSGSASELQQDGRVAGLYLGSNQS